MSKQMNSRGKKSHSTRARKRAAEAEKAKELAKK